ncbi:hypothetical protein CEXT_287191 [Caerostris extrusa]|uniref:Ycf15 n=1 Tax=Caerostris extrusa TaxID=172846 RepID=A0AAV4P1L9_CAEEX|nr:hypothetical protein CEXT_287191 [Caerostris extrusa]
MMKKSNLKSLNLSVLETAVTSTCLWYERESTKEGTLSEVMVCPVSPSSIVQEGVGGIRRSFSFHPIPRPNPHP